MLNQHRTAITAVIVVNVLLVLFFVLVNYGIWSEFNNSKDLSTTRMTPFWIQDYRAGALSNGNYIAIGAFVLMPNFPFLLFFLSTAINLIFIFYFALSKETKPLLEYPGRHLIELNTEVWGVYFGIPKPTVFSDCVS